MPSTEPTRNVKPSVAQLIRWSKLWISLPPDARAAIVNSRPGQLHNAHRAIRRRWAWAVYLAGAVFFCQSHALTTKKLYQLSLRTLINYLQDRPVADITITDLRRYMAYLRSDYVPHRVSSSTRKNTPLSSAAIDNHWKCLRSFFRWATDELKIPNPAENLARPHYQDPQIIPYSAEEVAALIQAAEFYRITRGEKVVAKQRPTGKRNRAIVLTLLDTGIRIGECCRLKVANVLLEGSEIQIQPFSTGRKTKPRTIPLGKATRLALWRYITSQSDLDPAHLLFGMGTESMHRLILSIGKWAHYQAVGELLTALKGRQ